MLNFFCLIPVSFITVCILKLHSESSSNPTVQNENLSNFSTGIKSFDQVCIETLVPVRVVAGLTICCWSSPSLYSLFSVSSQFSYKKCKICNFNLLSIHIPSMQKREWVGEKMRRTAVSRGFIGILFASPVFNHPARIKWWFIVIFPRGTCILSVLFSVDGCFLTWAFEEIFFWFCFLILITSRFFLFFFLHLDLFQCVTPLRPFFLLPSLFGLSTYFTLKPNRFFYWNFKCKIQLRNDPDGIALTLR